MSWSKDYKKSIDCNNPKGFSQRAHCAGRKKKLRGEITKSKSPFNEMHEVKTHKTVEQIAKKHRIDVSLVKRQLEMGIPIEHEHTKDKDLATDIALQHLEEIPDYYTRLKKMEFDAKKEHKKFKDVKEHCGCEDNAVEELEDQLKDLKNPSYDSIDKLMRRIMKKHDITAKQLHNAFVDKNGKTPDDWIEELKEGTLHHWFKGSRSKSGKPGWVQADGSPCANEPGETKTAKCFSSARLKSLKRKGKKGLALIKSAVRRKRSKDKGQQAKSGAAAPTNVPTFAKGKKDPNYVKAEPGIKEQMEIKEAKKDKPGKGSGKKDACYHKVKSRYDVWPSAYASGALVKCRKVGAANWGTQSEEMEMLRYCPKCKKDEKRSDCKYGPKYWDMFSLPSKLGSVDMSDPHYYSNGPHPGNMPEGYDHEYSMARSELSTIIAAAKRLRKKMKGEGNIEAWVQSKITKAADYIDSVADYIESGEHNVDEAKKCWPGYEKKGTQKLFGKTYNRCVKKEQFSNWRDELIISEKWEDKLKNMTPDQIENLKKSNPGAAEKIDAMRKKAASATPRPVGSGSQLPSVPKPSATQNRGQNTRAQQASYDRVSAARRQGAQNVAAAQAKRAAKRAAKTAAKPSLLKTLSKVKNPRVAIPLAIAGGIYGLLTGPKKQQKEEYSNWRGEMGLSEDWQKVNRKDKTDGLSPAAVKAYRRENPGSKLQTAVTEKKPKGKRAKRRASFCRRMKGMKSELTSAKTARDPDSRINKALRRWNCN